MYRNHSGATMPTNTAVSASGSSYQIRDNPLYGVVGHKLHHSYTPYPKALRPSSPLAIRLSQRTSRIRDKSLPSGAYECAKYRENRAPAATISTVEHGGIRVLLTEISCLLGQNTWLSTRKRAKKLYGQHTARTWSSMVKIPRNQGFQPLKE